MKKILVIAGLLGMAPGMAWADVDQKVLDLEKKLGKMEEQVKELKAEQATDKSNQEENQNATRVLAEAVDGLKNAFTIPEEIELESRYGLAPAAAKVYGKESGLSIGGYGEAVFRQPLKGSGKKLARTDFQRLIMYLGYKFNDWIVLNTEIEFEHGSTSQTKSSSGGSVSVEFAYLDFFFHETINARVGMLLMPMGIINEIHEPVSFFGVDRPEVDQRIIPTTWRENGAGIFGEFGDMVDYRVYAINSLNGLGFDAKGFRGGRQKGGKALAENWAFVGRVDVEPVNGLLLGSSIFTGNTGQNQIIDNVALPESRATIWEIHGQWIWRQLEIRSELAMSWLGQAGQLTNALQEVEEIGSNEAVASQMLGLYGEVGYDLMPYLLTDTDQQLLPFFRYEYVNTQFAMPSGYQANGAYEEDIFTVGVNYKPISQVVLKLDYRNFDPKTGSSSDYVNVGVGFIF